jgi:hypothetical protein
MISRFIRSSATTPFSLQSREARVAWQMILALASAVMSLTLACVVPFPAMAMLVSRTLSRRAGIVALLSAVLANQAVGFLILGYPWTLATVAWAPVYAVATLLALAVSRRIAQPLPALVAAFATYEVVLAAFSLATTRSISEFTPQIVGQVALGNALGCAVLGLAYLGIVAIERSTSRRDVRAAQ